MTDEVNESLNASMLVTDVGVDATEEHREEAEQAEEEEDQLGPSCMQPKRPGKKCVPVTYPDDVTMKIIDAWCESPELYKKEHKGYVLG